MDENSMFALAQSEDVAVQPLLTDYCIDRVTLADYIYPAIQKQYIAILTHEADVIGDGDIEAVHQMRVSLRRLRSLIQAFAPIMDVPKVMGNKPIGKIAKILGKVRDLDVLHDTCKGYEVNLPDSERSHLDEVVTIVAKRRRKAMFKVKLMFEEKDYQYFKLALNNWLNYPQYTSAINVPIESILPDLLLATVGQLFLNSGWWINTNLDSESDPEIAVTRSILIHGQVFHNLRKQVKAVRYLMELFPDRYNSAYSNYLKDFKQIHQLFGDIQDRIVLDNFIQRSLGKRTIHKLPTIYAQISRDNYLSWQKWQIIQNRYQPLAARQELQLLLIQGTIHQQF